MAQNDFISILRNSAWLVSARVVTKVGTTLLVIYAAGRIGDANFGVFSSLLAFTSLFALLGEFGLTVPLIRTIARRTRNPGVALGRVLTLKSPLAILALFLLIGTALLFDVPKNLTIVFGLSMFFETQSISVMRSFEGFEKMEYVAAITLVERTVFCLSGFLVLFWNGGLMALAWTYTLTNIVSLLLAVFVFTKRFDRIQFGIPFRESLFMLREAAPFFAAGIFSVLYSRADVFVLTAARSQSEVGWYNATTRVVEAQMFVPMAVVGALFPVMARYATTRPSEFVLLQRKVFSILFILGVAGACGTYLFAHEIISILYSSEYTSSADLLKIVSLMLPFFFANFLLGNVLIAMGKEFLSTGTLALGAVISSIIDIQIVDTYGSKGIMTVRVLTEIFAFCVQFYLVVKLTKQMIPKAVVDT